MEEQVQGKLYDGRLLRRLLAYLLPYRWSVVVAVICMMIGAALEVAGPWLTKVAVDRYLAPQTRTELTWLDPYLSNNPTTGMLQIAGLYLAVLVSILAVMFSQSLLMTSAGQRALADLRRETMAHLQRLDLAFYDRTPVGRLLTRVTTDADALSELFTSSLVPLLGDVLTLSLVLVVMLRLSVELTLVLLAAMPVVILVTVTFRKRVTGSNRRIRTAVARINSYLQEHLSGMVVLQLFNREERSRKEFADANREHMDAYKEAIVAYAWFYPVVEFCGMVTVASLLAYGGYQVQGAGLSLGILIAFFQYGMRFFRPIQDLSEKYNIVQAAVTAAERIFQLLDTPPGITAPAERRALPGPPAIEFDHAWFAYKGEDWVLRDVSFRIEPGETIAVVGHTGAGKTTLSNLLLRFYDLQRGSIRIDGVDIRQMPLEQVRERFAVVLQDPFLFSGSLQENIRLGTAAIDHTRIRQAVDAVNLTAFVESLSDGLDYQVHERGAGLSTGQKQLISFARALAHNPQFLILDEATSSVDTETEIKIRAALDRLVEGRTSLIIAHRLSTIQKATRIFVMHKGQLRETGTHQELLAQRGIYWKLYKLQYQGQDHGAGERLPG
ncbi:MAG: ABC transporter ATP-binding protein [Bryobacterales bacterium]|nr:ABC transporter ATP-binding protein [Bryobacterales bacterium]